MPILNQNYLLFEQMNHQILCGKLRLKQTYIYNYNTPFVAICVFLSMIFCFHIGTAGEESSDEITGVD